MNIDKIEIKEFLKGEIDRIEKEMKVNPNNKLKLTWKIVDFLRSEIGYLDTNILDFAYITFYENGEYEESLVRNPLFWGIDSLMDRVQLIIDNLIEDIDNPKIKEVIIHSLGINLDEYR